MADHRDGLLPFPKVSEILSTVSPLHRFSRRPMGKRGRGDGRDRGTAPAILNFL